MNAGRYKRTFDSTTFHQSEYATEKGLFRDGSQDWPGAVMSMRSSLIEPIPSPDTVNNFKVKTKEVVIGTIPLKCLSLSYVVPAKFFIPGDFYTECLDPAIGVPRVSSVGPFQTTYGKFGVFQGHYLARELHQSFNGQPRFDLTIDVVESLKEAVDVINTPPPNALAVDLSTVPLRLKSVGQLTRLKEAYPRFIPGAHGLVVVRITVGKDGQVTSKEVLSGPYEARQPSVDAIQQWLFKPFEVMAQPHEVEVEVQMGYDIH